MSALQHYLAPLNRVLAVPDVTEVCVNRPGELWLEAAHGWQCIGAAWATFDWAMHFGRLLAAASQQRLTSQHPLLSAAMPGGERVQIVVPPATQPGSVVIAVRRNVCHERSLDELIASGLAGSCLAGEAAPGTVMPLSLAYAERRWGDFLREAVRARQNIVVSGATGAGKTTLTRALIGEVGTEERLVTIEDTPELNLKPGMNAVRLYYAKDDQGLSRLTPKHLLEACLRLRPDRILLAELRGEEAYEYLRAVNSGHPGSITSVHASSCRLALEQLALLVKSSDAGRDMQRRDIHALLRQVVDVIVHCDRTRGQRYIREIWWRGARRARAARGAQP